MSLITSPRPSESSTAGASLLARYRAVRAQTEALGEPLEPEDFVLQSMPDASPVKWHFAHTSWFFETFVLKAADPEYQPRFPQYNYLFNSYYNTIGERIARDRRGLLSRPSIGEVRRYRSEIDARVEDWLSSADPESLREIEPVLVLGLHHEQQHQELIVTDLKHAFAANPLRPVYRDRDSGSGGESPPLRWVGYPSGLHRIGHEGAGFAFDNESPPAFGIPRTVRDRVSTDHQRRIPRLPRRPGLRPARVLALRRMGHAEGPGDGRPPSTGSGSTAGG